MKNLFKAENSKLNKAENSKLISFLGKKSHLISYLIADVALVCAVLVGYHTDFSWLVFILILLTLLSSIVFCKKYNNIGVNINRMLIGAMFIFSSFLKGVDPLGTKYKMQDYFLAYKLEWMNDAALVLAVIMILAEFIVGICLLVNVLPRLATLGATLLMLFFTTITYFDAKYNLVPDCGCFGTAIKMSNWQTFFKNLVIDAVLIPVIANNKLLKNRLLTYIGQWVAATVLMIAFLWFQIYNIRHLPVIDFMDWKVGRDMSALRYDPGEIYVTYQNNQTGELQEFKTPNYPWNDTVWMKEWSWVSTRTEGGSASLGFEILDAEGEGNEPTKRLFSTENLYVFVAPYIQEFSEKDFENCRKMIEIIEKNGYNHMWITAELPEYIEEISEQYPMFYEVYFGDELELKTMVRSNPGLMLIDKGVIKNKWSRIDFPIE